MSYFVKATNTSGRTTSTKCHNRLTAEALVRGLQEKGGYYLIHVLIQDTCSSVACKVASYKRESYSKSWETLSSC